MLYVVRFVDKPERLQQRQEFLPSHLAWLDENAACVLAAGSLRPDPDEPPVGTMWIVAAEDHAHVDAIIRKDPFWKHGIRESYEVLHWSKAFPEKKTLI